MFDLINELPTKKVLWKNLYAGLVIIDGIKINGYLPVELLNYPLITDDLLNKLTQKYKFLPDREVLVLDGLGKTDISSLPEKIYEYGQKIFQINQVRKSYVNEKSLIFKNNHIAADISLPVVETDLVNPDRLIYNQYNSFDVKIKNFSDEARIPSFFTNADIELTLGQVFGGRLNSVINLPDDSRVTLHLVIDYSASMDHYGKIDLAIASLESFVHYTRKFLSNTNIIIYAFSEDCKIVRYPLNKKEIVRGETDYPAFMSKVLRYFNEDAHNKIILFTDGLSGNMDETLRFAGKIKKQKIDYTQIIFNFKNEKSSIVLTEGLKGVDGFIKGENLQTREMTPGEMEEELKSTFNQFTKIAEHAGGNQVIVKINEAINLVSIECFDRYLGLLTVPKQEIIFPQQPDTEFRKFEFKRI